MKSLINTLQEALVKKHIPSNWNNNTDLPITYKGINIVVFDKQHSSYDNEEEAQKNWNSNISNTKKQSVIQIIYDFINKLKDNTKYIKELVFHNFEDYVDEDSGDIYICINFNIIDNNEEEYNLAIDYDNDKSCWISKAYRNIDLKKFISLIKK